MLPTLSPEEEVKEKLKRKSTFRDQTDFFREVEQMIRGKYESINTKNALPGMITAASKKSLYR